MLFWQDQVLAAKQPKRSRDLARIHILKGQIGLTDDIYRDVLWVHGRVGSSKDLDSHGRAQVIAHLQGLAERLGKGAPGAKRPHNIDAADNTRELKKIEALLTDAALPWAYADKILQQQTRGRVQRMTFASAHQLAAVIAALHRAAIKRLSAELARELGEEWETIGGEIAEREFGIDADKHRLTAYPETMSRVLHWQREHARQP